MKVVNLSEIEVKTIVTLIKDYGIANLLDFESNEIEAFNTILAKINDN